MQGYTYTKGEHYPVEHLVFKVAPEDVEHYLAVDHEIWTLKVPMRLDLTISRSFIRKSGSMIINRARYILYLYGRASNPGERLTTRNTRPS